MGGCPLLWETGLQGAVLVKKVTSPNARERERDMSVQPAIGRVVPVQVTNITRGEIFQGARNAYRNIKILMEGVTRGSRRTSQNTSKEMYNGHQ